MSIYSAITLLLAILMIAMTIHVLNHHDFNKKQKGWFIATFVAIVFCSLAEFCLHGIPYDPRFRIPLTILTVLQFSIAPCFAMLFAGALGLRRQVLAVTIMFGVCVTIGIICAPFGWVFTFNESGYIRGPHFVIYLITYVTSLVYLVISLFVVGKRFRVRDLGTIIMVVVILATGIIPMTLYELHVAYIAVGMSACICYVYYNDLVQHDTHEELIENQEKISNMQVEIISGLSNIIESRDTETGAHVARTSAYVQTLAEDARAEGVYADILDDYFIELLCKLAPMHDVGKILVSDKILLKPGKLTPEEFEEMKKHAALGGKVIRQILSGIADEEYMKFASDIATYHHEWWNGNGYPTGLKEEEIPLAARIMTIADVFDALVSKRCYKEPIPIDESFKIIEEGSGTHFDPNLVKVFLNHKEKYVEIINRIGNQD